MKRIILTINYDVMAVTNEDEVTLADELKSAVKGFFVQIGQAADGRVMVDIGVQDVEQLLSLIPTEAEVTVVGVWQRNGMPYGLGYDDEGYEVGHPSYEFNLAEYLKHLPDMDEEGTRPTEFKAIHNIGGWATVGEY